MPIYEYNCPKCGDFDQMQKITEGPLKKCPTCKAKVTKLISNPAFHLKGGGWYITDYGRKDSGGGASSESKSEDSGSSSSSTETKSEKAEKSDKKEKKADKKGSSATAAA
jgi:putative FmdB family regulatory protein